jgi:uncharacterized membrane protein
MTTLITLTYPNGEQAKAALGLLQDMQRQQLIEIDDAVIAHHQGDKIKLEQAMNLTGAGAAGGALWGGLFGLIFLMPIAGMAIGAATGALAGKFTDYGIDDKFAKEMQQKLGPGETALVLMIRRSSAPDRVLAEMKRANLQGEIFQTNLSEADEQRLRDMAASV